MLTLFAFLIGYQNIFAEINIFKINAPFPESSSEGQFWKKDIQKLQKKGIKIEWLWSQSEKNALESIAKEKSDGIIISGPGLSAMSKTTSTIEKPYAFAKKEEGEAFLLKNKIAIINELKNYGLYPLRQFYIAPVYLYGKKDFEKTKSFVGLKIWLWSATSSFKGWIIEQKAKAVNCSPQKVLEKLKTSEIEIVYAIESAAKRLEWDKQASFRSKDPVAHAFGYLLLRRKIYDNFPKSEQDF